MMMSERVTSHESESEPVSLGRGRRRLGDGNSAQVFKLTRAWRPGQVEIQVEILNHRVPLAGGIRRARDTNRL